MKTGVIAARLPGVSAKPKSKTRKRRPGGVNINLVPWILLILTLTLGCLLSVQARTMVIQERYRLERVQKMGNRVRMENKKLRIAWATLTSPNQIERVARRRFQLHYAKPEEMVSMP
jgi:cell division protein FtsL